MDQASFYCPRCQQMRLFQSQGMNHTPHILASVFLCGLWLPIWILMAIFDSPRFHCAFCGYTDEHKYLAQPGLRNHEAQQAAAASTLRAEQIAARGDLTFSERIVYLVSDHKDVFLLLGLVALVFGVIFVAIAVTSGHK